MKSFIHTPEGVRDIYGSECRQKRQIQEQIHQTFASFGYEDIETPTFEFFDVFGSQIGTTPSRELYKFFDKEGNTLVLRPDFTPSIGRCAAKYFSERTIPLRLTYLGNTYTNTSNLQGKLKEITQMGVELIGDYSLMADAEAVHLAIASLKAAGLKEFQISIGEIGFFKGICEEAGLEEETEEELRNYISHKDYFGAEELLNSRKLSKKKIQSFLKITELFGSCEVLEDAKGLVNNQRSKQALERLEKLYELLKLYGDEKYVSFDLGLISRYHYYTGIIFKGYTYGVGDAIVTGGRYDRLLSFFGKDTASIGFVIHVDGVVQALSSKKLLPKLKAETILLLYDEETAAEAIRYANELRKLGDACQLLLCDKEEETFINLAKREQKKAVLKMTQKGIKKLYEFQET
ncbi:MAG: ATP phosphoribosyltransferase regulatory subunit [Lachnospiraceae bacterium]|nr:ATP phosphoribosyltransferase regulatory subunit [Lachnospiraceae bacterium]